MPLTAEQETTIRKHSLDLKFDWQLTAMRDSHATKLAAIRDPLGPLARHTTDLDGIGSIKWKLKERGLLRPEIADKLFDLQTYWINKDRILDEIVTHIDLEVAARLAGDVVRTPV